MTSLPQEGNFWHRSPYNFWAAVTTWCRPPCVSDARLPRRPLQRARSDLIRNCLYIGPGKLSETRRAGTVECTSDAAANLARRLGGAQAQHVPGPPCRPYCGQAARPATWAWSCASDSRPAAVHDEVVTGNIRGARRGEEDGSSLQVGLGTEPTSRDLLHER